jgi:hypothetical protein
MTLLIHPLTGRVEILDGYREIGSAALSGKTG